MGKPLHPDYIYIDSELLKQRVALHKKSGWLICEDKYPDGKLVSYSPKEIDIFYEAGTQITMAVHAVKKILTGEVVSYEQADEKTSDLEKQSNDSANVSKNDPVVQGELEIY